MAKGRRGGQNYERKARNVGVKTRVGGPVGRKIRKGQIHISRPSGYSGNGRSK